MLLVLRLEKGFQPELLVLSREGERGKEGREGGREEGRGGSGIDKCC